GFEWDYLKYHSVKSLPQVGPVTSVVFSPDGSRLAVTALWSHKRAFANNLNNPTISFDEIQGEVKLWDALSGQQLFSLPSNNVICAAFSENGKQLISVSDRGTIRIWDTNTGQAKVVLDSKSISGLIYKAAFSSDGKLVALINNYVEDQEDNKMPKERGQIKIWDVSGKE